ncbi:hypothetical protein Tco_0314097 [Tanacetum coccineum]
MDSWQFTFEMNSILVTGDSFSEFKIIEVFFELKKSQLLGVGNSLILLFLAADMIGCSGLEKMVGWESQFLPLLNSGPLPKDCGGFGRMKLSLGSLFKLYGDKS